MWTPRRADLDNAKVTLDRTRKLLQDGVTTRQALDDAQARYDSAVYKVNALQKTLELVKLGPRQRADRRRCAARWNRPKARWPTPRRRWPTR